VKLGIQADFRNEESVRNFAWKEIIDSGDGRSFENNYPDTGIVSLSSPLSKRIYRVVVGIDIGSQEILAMLEWSRRSGKQIDLFIGHHPAGRLLTVSPLMIYSHKENLKVHGIDIHNLENSYKDLIENRTRKILSSNFLQLHDMSHYLDVDYITIHTPADNISAQFVKKHLENTQPETLEDTISSLLTIEEYTHYHGMNIVTPLIISGEKDAKLGRFILTEFTGGEDGPIEVYEEIKKQGVDTIICMHLAEEALELCKKIGLQVIATGHMASDSIGMNSICDMLSKEGIEVLPVSGFVRVERN
jgi:hypothetical protein